VADNTYTGPTTIDAGSLVVFGAQAFSNVTVNSGGTLLGIGTVRNIVANAGGSVWPGSLFAGVLSAGPAVTLNAASTFHVGIFGTTPGSYSQLNVNGTVSLAGDLSVTVGVVPMPGNVFTIISASTSVTGTFASLPNGTVFCADGRAFQINYTANTVTLTVVADMSVPVVTAPTAVTVTQTLCQ
ncbi:MAG TPA: autotransporter, partial [Thermoanaerobaculia bacterium]|nr:autotransporter [Thermoanaerobaculia bacterium]